MVNKNTLSRSAIVLIAVLAVVVITVGAVSATSFLNKPSGSHKFKSGMNGTQTNLIQEAIKNNDYTTWKSLMELQLTQDNFNRFVNMSSYTEGFRQNISNFGNFTGMKIPHFGNLSKFSGGNWTKRSRDNVHHNISLS